MRRLAISLAFALGLSIGAAHSSAAVISFELQHGFPEDLRVDATLDDSIAGSVKLDINVVTDGDNPLTGDIFAVGIGFSSDPTSYSNGDVWGDYDGAILSFLGLDSVYGIGDSFFSLFLNDSITSTSFIFEGVGLSDFALIATALHYVHDPSPQPEILFSTRGSDRCHQCGRTSCEHKPEYTLAKKWDTVPPPPGEEEVPEPATLTLMGGALLALIAIRRKRQA